MAGLAAIGPEMQAAADRISALGRTPLFFERNGRLLGMIAAAGLIGLDAKNARRIWKRDRRNHASPNSAQTESVCAGALHVQLGGGASYFGVWVEKPTIGDADRAIERADVKRSCSLLYGTSILWLVVFEAIAWIGGLLL
jgi:adenosylcobinamide-phosphate synthase